MGGRRKEREFEEEGGERVRGGRVSMRRRKEEVRGGKWEYEEEGEGEEEVGREREYEKQGGGISYPCSGTYM